MPGLISHTEPDCARKVLKIFRAASPGLEKSIFIYIFNFKLHLIFLLEKLLSLCALAENLLGGGVGRPVGPGAQEGRVYVVRSHRHHRHARPLKPELVLTSD